MDRLACIDLPAFPLQLLLRRHPEWARSPAAVVDEDRPLGRILVIGGIHGDEYSSVSVVFKWMDILNIHHSGLFHWHFIPLSNPDGLLQPSSQRQNARGVDLNRNFPCPVYGDHPDGQAWQPETIAMMNFITQHSFVLSANYHG